MRPLVIDADARAQAQRVLDHATEHHYWPNKTVQSPGDDPRFVAKLGTYRVVFTFTHSKGIVWRHLSVSVPSQKYPNPAAVFMIAGLFGFTGYDEKQIDKPGPDWAMDVNEGEHCVVIAQPCGHEHERRASH